jgi:hypothetical protein
MTSILSTPIPGSLSIKVVISWNIEKEVDSILLFPQTKKHLHEIVPLGLLVAKCCEEENFPRSALFGFSDLQFLHVN